MIKWRETQPVQKKKMHKYCSYFLIQVTTFFMTDYVELIINSKSAISSFIILRNWISSYRCRDPSLHLYFPPFFHIHFWHYFSDETTNQLTLPNLSFFLNANLYSFLYHVTLIYFFKCLILYSLYIIHFCIVRDFFFILINFLKLITSTYCCDIIKSPS